MGRMRQSVTVIAALLTAQAFAGHFDGWHKFGSGADGSTWYLYSDSVKTIHHVKTGNAVGKYVWAGWAMPDGSYNQARYSVYCDSATYSTEGALQGDSNGAEGPLGDVFQQPYRPQTFVYVLAGVVCR